MKAPSPCGKCGGLAFWKVREMQEHAFFRASPLGDIDRVAPLETLICTACGYTVWYSGSDDLREQPGAVASVVDDRVRCADCAGMPHLLVALVHEWPHNPLLGAKALPVAPVDGVGPRGKFAMLVCSGCGRCEWFAWGFAEHEELGTADREPCARCSVRERRTVRPLREESGEPLPVVIRRGWEMGEFEVRFCAACGYSEWCAHVGKLDADGEFVIHIEGERRAAPAAGGPYR